MFRSPGVNRRLYLRGAWVWQHTHGGLRLGSPITGQPFPPPGEFTTPERFTEVDRLLHVRVMQLGGGLSVDLGPVDVFASYSKYFWGRDAHNSLGARRAQQPRVRSRRDLVLRAA